MRQDAWRAYLEMALGVTEASRKKAVKAVKELAGKGGLTGDQLQGLADELARASAANREVVANVVRVEIDRALNAVGLAKADEVTSLHARVRELEAQLSAGRASSDGGGAAGELEAAVRANEEAARFARKETEQVRAAVSGGSSAAVSAGGRAAGNGKKPTAEKKAVEKRAVAKKTVAKKVGSDQPSAKKAVASGSGSGSDRPAAKKATASAVGQPMAGAATKRDAVPKPVAAAKRDAAPRPVAATKPDGATKRTAKKSGRRAEPNP